MNFKFAFAVVLAAVCVAYANHFHNGFHFDDWHTVTANPYIRDLSNIPRFFTDPKTFSIEALHQTYRPLVSVSLALDYRLGGRNDVLWFHLSTFLIYLAQLVAMYFLFAAVLNSVRRDQRNRYIALFGTALYGLHPAMAETVNYIVQRGDVYVAFGIVAGLALYSCLPRWRAFGIYLIPFAFAAWSKQSGLIFPLFLLMYVLYFENEADVALYRQIIKIVPALVLCGLRAWLEATLAPASFSFSPESPPVWAYLITQPFVLLRYFAEFFLPVHLSADTDLHTFDGLTGAALMGFLFVAAVGVTAWLTARQKTLRPISFGLTWFLVGSIPTSLYPLAEVENDHRMFLPFIGLALAVSWALALGVEAYLRRNDSKGARNAIAAACVVVLVAYGYGTHVRNEVWRNDESLWYDVTKKSPHNGRGLMEYAWTEMQKDRYAVAVDYLLRARALSPTYTTIESNLGFAYDGLGRPDEAEPHFQRAVLLDPSMADPRYYYARWLNANGRAPEAVAQLKAAIKDDPSSLVVETRRLLVRAYADSGATSEARRAAADLLHIAPSDVGARRLLAATPQRITGYWLTAAFQACSDKGYLRCIASAREALRRKPRSFAAYHDISIAYASLGIWDKAIENERRALALDPQLTAARTNLVGFEQRKRREPRPKTPEEFLAASLRYHKAGLYPESIAAARRALRQRPNYAEAYDRIAVGDSIMGKWDDAIAAASSALHIAPSDETANTEIAWAWFMKRHE